MNRGAVYIYHNFSDGTPGRALTPGPASGILGFSGLKGREGPPDSENPAVSAPGIGARTPV